jgi:DNA polymerase-1
MPSGVAAERLYLVDAHSLIFQVFHAIPEMTSPDGLPTNAIFGFTKDMLFLRGLKPTHLIVVFDAPGKTFRDAIYAEYKAHRAPMPDDLQLQIPRIHEMLDAMRIPVLSMCGFEADDLIATLASAGDKLGHDVYVCTGDKDMRQLINDRVRVFNLRKRLEFGRAELLADWGVTPEQVVDLQAMVGDAVDNVPGVPGIGYKTGAQLLQEFGTLDNILANVDKVKGAKKQENLRAFVDKVEMTRSLLRLACNVPLTLEWDKWRLLDWDTNKLLRLVRGWGFRSLADQVQMESSRFAPRSEGDASRSESAAQAEAVQGELFAFGANVSAGNGSTAMPIQVAATMGEHRYELVDTPEKFDAFYRQLRKQKRFAIDLETTGLNPLEAEIVGYAVCWKPGEAYYLPVKGPAGDAVLDNTDVLEKLRPILEGSNAQKINQNIKYDLLVLKQHGIQTDCVAGDSMVADYLLHSGERSHSMEDLARRYLNHQVIPITDLIGKRGKNQINMDQVPTAKVCAYSGEDADVALRLCDLLEPQLADCGLADLYRNLEVPLICVLAELEYNGIRIDIPRLRQLGDEMTRQLADIETQIHEVAGRPFNINSPKQLREVLFKEMKLPTQRRTGITGEASTDQETLERLAAIGHELPKKIVEYRQIAKLKGTYVDALPEMVNKSTGRIHASFNQTVTSTGRLSSSDPNLQNIPIRSEQGKQIRQAFIPAEGWLLITADYSQIELRLLAHFSGDEELRRAFADDRDIHSLVAAQIFNVDEALVTSQMRRMAKTVNFGVIYGMSAHGLAQRLGIPREEAAEFIDAYFARYPKVLKYQQDLLHKAIRNRYVSTILGRRREITGIRAESTYQQRSQPEREAINMEIQGSAADLIKVAMLRISRRLRAEERRARMLLQIHDELVFEVPPEELSPVAALITTEMTTALRLDVPLKVDVAAGPNWLDVDEVKAAELVTA